MDKEIKREAGKQYLHYFRVWFIIAAVLAVLCAAVGILHSVTSVENRGNLEPSYERVFDYADVLTDAEEESLAEYIAECEQKYHFDIVLVTINEDVESKGSWNTGMMAYADDFYDQGNYGYDRVHGNGMLLLDNWYTENGESQKGSWLSTAGKVYQLFGNPEIDQVLCEVDERIESSPYRAYRAGIREACRLVERLEGNNEPIPWLIVMIGPIVVALFYAISKLHQPPAKDTTTATTYVAGGKPLLRDQRDDFVRKSVVSRRIESSSGSSGGGGHSGGGGGHVSSGGVSHGGGGHRR